MSKSESCTNLSTIQGHIYQNYENLSLYKGQSDQIFVHIVNLLIYSFKYQFLRSGSHSCRTTPPRDAGDRISSMLAITQAASLRRGAKSCDLHSPFSATSAWPHKISTNPSGSFLTAEQTMVSYSLFICCPPLGPRLLFRYHSERRWPRSTAATQ